MNEDERACPRCAETIKKDAVICRFCGLGRPEPADRPINVAAGPKRNSFQSCMGWVSLVIGGFFVIALLDDPGKWVNSTQATDSALAPAPSRPESLINADGTVDAANVERATVAELVDAYEANEAAAQFKYGRGWIVVTGKIERIDLDFSDKPVVFFESDVFPAASATFTPGAESIAASLKKGATVTLICGKLHEALGTPILENCSRFSEDMIVT